MRGLGILYRLARADVLERVRRYSFLVTLAASLWLLYLALTGQLKMYLGDYRGVYNSAWTGLLMALSAGTFVSLAGFYVVKGSVERDRRTGVGQILAATRIRTTTYLLSKFLSNLTVLSAILAVLGVAAIVLQAVHGEISTVNLWQLLSPLLLLAMPAMAMVAAVAVFFETIGWLSGGFGNVVFFLLWNIVLVIPIANDCAQIDLLGLHIAEEILQEAASSRFPDYNGDFAFGLGPNVDLSQKQTFVWEGIYCSAPLLQNRLAWTLLAVLLAVLGSFWFDRFDPSTSALRRASPTGAGTSLAISPLARVLQPLLRILQWRRTGVMIAAELRITLNGISTWWYVVLTALFLVALFSPLGVVKQSQVYIWIWPILVWSKLGTRERRHKTEQMLFSAPQPIRRQLVATWLASVIFTFATATPVLLRLLLAGEDRDAIALCIGAAFIPTLALATGVWSQSSKLFEAVYLVWWYLGPVHSLAPLDFTGIVSNATGWTIPLSYAAGTVALLWLAVWGRKIQLSRM